MKKVVTLILICVMGLLIGAPTLASTIAVNVDPGFTIDVSKKISPSEDPFTILAQFGVNDQLLIEAGYTNSDPTLWSAGIRYELMKNVACIAKYESQDSAHTTIVGLLGKKDFDENFALVGEFDYASYSDSTSGYTVTGQAEYALAEALTLNGGLKYDNTNNVSTTSYLLGAEINPNDNFCIYFDYEKPTNADGTLTAGISFTF